MKKTWHFVCLVLIIVAVVFGLHFLAHHQGQSVIPA